MSLNELSLRKKLALLVLVTVLSLMVACSWRPTSGTSNPTTSPPPIEEVTVKPQPRVLGVTVSTTGFFEDYYAILDAEIKNDGSQGSVLVIASITQAGNTSSKQMPVSLGRNEKQVIRFIFPLKWKGGEWTPKVTTELP